MPQSADPMAKTLFDKIFGGSKKDTTNTQAVKPADTVKTRKQLRQERRDQKKREKELEKAKKAAGGQPD